MKRNDVAVLVIQACNIQERALDKPCTCGEGERGEQTCPQCSFVLSESTKLVNNFCVEHGVPSR